MNSAAKRTLPFRLLRPAACSFLHRTGLADGEPIWGEWDVAIVLDACRPDALATVADSFDWLPDSIPSRRSVASTSKPWLERTFVHSEYDCSRTAYVTGNPNTVYYGRALSRELLALDEVWRYAWDNDLGTIRPRPITDRAIATWRDGEAEQMIVHYMQPHFPSIPQPVGEGVTVRDDGFTDHDTTSKKIRRGEVSVSEAWEAYVANLRHVLEDVGLLLHSVSAASVVLTADHGEAFGEWGVYGHRPNIPISAIRSVPYVKLSAEDDSEYSPSEYAVTEGGSHAAREKLEALGYQ